jgi:CRP-like cAMP-binding protein
MSTDDFFDYPTEAVPQEAPLPAATFLEDATDRDWEALFSYTQTRQCYGDEIVFKQDDFDRSLYLLTIGQLEIGPEGEPVEVLDAPAPFNVIAFLDDGRCDATARATTDSEMLRLSFDAFESLAMREPVLARKILLDLGRIVARALRSTGA